MRKSSTTVVEPLITLVGGASGATPRATRPGTTRWVTKPV
jgi:hypothetical protein